MLTRVTNYAWCNWVNLVQVSLVQFSSSAVNTALIDRQGPVYHATSVHLYRAKLITRFDDRCCGETKFSKSRIRDKVPQESTVMIEDTRVAL